MENPQSGLDWLNNLTRHALDKGDTAAIFVARAQREPGVEQNDEQSTEQFVALPLLMKRRGTTAMALSTFYTSLYCPVVHTDDPLPLFTALFKHLARTEHCCELILMPLDVQSSHHEDLLAAQLAAGWKGLHSYFCFGNWVHKLKDKSFSAYLASRPSRVRNTIRRKSAKFVEEPQGNLHLVQGSEHLEQAIEQFNAVYHNSWKVDEPYPEFIPSLVRLAAARGWLRMGIATYDTVPVAGQIWLVHHGVAYIYKLAYDENYKSMSPGTVLTAFMLESVISNDAIESIDYLSGDDVYKKDWMSERRERFGTAAYNPRTLRGLAKLIGHSVKRKLKRR